MSESDAGAQDGDLGLLGSSLPMARLRDDIRRVAMADETVLVLGETGSGKELVARAIHRLSARAKGPFLSVHCGALSSTILESELFGHVKGAYSGATQNREGKFQAAKGGTLFLDEINSAPAALQTKLLRAVQFKTFSPVGMDEEMTVDVRVLAASNRHLRNEVDEGRFREDLYFRLNVLRVNVPALREREDDVLELARHFLEDRCAANTRVFAGLSAAAEANLLRHEWPGNVRELEHVITRAVVMATTEGPDELLDVEIEQPTMDKSAGQDDAIAELVLEELLAGSICLDGLRQGSTRMGIVAAAVRDGVLRGLERFLVSEAGQEILRRGVGPGYFMPLIGLAVRRPGRESLLSSELRNGINELVNQMQERK